MVTIYFSFQNILNTIFLKYLNCSAVQQINLNSSNIHCKKNYLILQTLVAALNF